MTYKELNRLFCEHEDGNPEYHLTAHITFSSFGPAQKQDYPRESRTYIVSSDNKAFQPNMGGYSIFGSCLDGSEHCVRIENYMAEERGGKNGWVVEDCCIVGYLLLEDSSYGIGTPQIFYAIDKAQKEMLARMAKFAYADLALLSKEYRRNNCEADVDCCHAKRFRAYASTIRDSGSWEIRPIYISSPLNITIGDVQW